MLDTYRVVHSSSVSIFSLCLVCLLCIEVTSVLVCFSFSIVLSEREAYIVENTWMRGLLKQTMFSIWLMKLKRPVFFPFGTSYTQHEFVLSKYRNSKTILFQKLT